MKLQTNSAITINDGLSGTRSTKVTGEILKLVSQPNGNKLVLFKYEDEDGNQLITSKNHEEVLASDVQALYDVVKDSLPADTDYNNREWSLYYEVFKIKMVETFTDITSTSEISVI